MISPASGDAFVLLTEPTFGDDFFHPLGEPLMRNLLPVFGFSMVVPLQWVP